MTAHDIIDIVKGAAPDSDLRGWLDALCDGEFLSSVGLTDAQAAVEDAFGELGEELKRYDRLAAENGEFEFHGREYALLTPPALSNRIFAGWWGDVSDGDEYTAEYSAAAMGADGQDYVLRWRFTAVRGAEPDDDSCYDWDGVSEVVQ